MGISNSLTAKDIWDVVQLPAETMVQRQWDIIQMPADGIRRQWDIVQPPAEIFQRLLFLAGDSAIIE